MVLRAGEDGSLSAQTLSEIAQQLDTLRQAASRMEEERDEARRDQLHLSFVRDLAHRSGGRIPLNEFLRFCVQRLCIVLSLQDCAVVVAEPGRAEVAASAHEPLPTRLIETCRVTRGVLTSGEEFHACNLADHVEGRVLARWHEGALITLPMGVQEQPFGVLHLGLPRDHPLKPADLALAREVAYEVALAVDGARRFQEMAQKARQLERSREEIWSYFNQVGAAMSSALNLNQLLRMIVSLCIRVTQAQGGSLYLIENQRLHQRVVIGPESAQDVAGKVQVRESLVGWGAENELRVSLSTANVSQPARRMEVGAFLGVPLIIKDEVKGQLNIYSTDRREFSDEEVGLLSTFARQAALAIENAQIFEFESQRAREATALYKAARAIALSPSLDDVLDISTYQLLRITEADRCLIFLTNNRRSGFRLARSAGLSTEQETFFAYYRFTPAQFSPEIWESLSNGRQLYLTSPPTNCPALSRLFTLLPTNACLLVPLLAKETLLGLIVLDDSKITRYFDASQVRMVMTLSIQIATAVQKARLMGQLEENFEQLKALHQVSTGVTGTLSLPRVLGLVIDKACELLGNPSCALMVQMSGNGLRLQGSRDVPGPLAGEDLQNLIASLAAVRKRPATFYIQADEDRPRDTDEIAAHDRVGDALARSGLGGVLAVPLIARRKIVGVLNLFAQPGRHFSAAEIRLIRSFANQAAAALENARLHDIVKNKMHELAALFEIGKTITSTLQVDRVLEAIRDNVHQVMNADACAIMLLDPVRRQLTVKTAVGLGPQHEARTIRLGRGIAGVAAKTGRPMILIDEEGAGSRKFPESVRRDGLRTILSVPMSARGRIVGLINVYYRKIHYHELAEISLLTTLSSQAAVAIENASLYQEKHKVSEMLRNMLLPQETFHHPRLEVGHKFISSLELSGDYYDVVFDGDDRAVFCMADVAGKGPRAAMYAARAKYILKSYIAARYPPSRVLSMLNRIIVPETESDMFITLFCAEVDLAKGRLRYGSAGHEPPLLWRAAEKKCSLLKPRDILVGVSRDYAYRQRTVDIARGDLLIIYTDGVTEARPMGEASQFGLDRLQEMVANGAHLPAQVLANRITNAVIRHCRKKLNDDFSLMVVRMV